MKKQKRIIVTVLSVAVLLMCLLPVSAAGSSEPDGHLLYDKLDNMYYCIGSPKNCNFGNEDESEGE